MKAIYLLILLGVLTGCGKINFVSGAQVTNYTSGGDQFVQLAVDLNAAGLVLPTLSIPIPDLKNPSLDYGSISINPSALGITVNISVVANLPTLGSSDTLPNGTALPVSNYDPSSMLSLTLAGSNSEAYIEFNQAKKEALFGTAIAISEFNIGVPVDLFVPFTLPNGISGVAGVFTGTQTGQSGFAFFADVSPVLTSLATVVALNEKMEARPSNLSQTILSGPMRFETVTPSTNNMIKLNKMLDHLRNNRTPLHVN